MRAALLLTALTLPLAAADRVPAPGGGELVVREQPTALDPVLERRLAVPVSVTWTEVSFVCALDELVRLSGAPVVLAAEVRGNELPAVSGSFEGVETRVVLAFLAARAGLVLDREAGLYRLAPDSVAPSVRSVEWRPPAAAPPPAAPAAPRLGH